MVKIKKTLAILLAVCFLASITAAAVSAREWDGKYRGDWDKYNNKNFKKWYDDGDYNYHGNKWKGHYDDYGNFWHHHKHQNMKDGKKYWNDHWHRFNYEHGWEKWDKNGDNDWKKY